MLMRKQQGLSLIELMITISLGLLLMAALTTVFSNTLGVNSRSLQLSQLNEESVAVFDLMLGDIRRADYRGDAIELLTDPDEASTEFNDTIEVSEFGGEANDSCIVFRYDENQNGIFDGASEAFGYRLANGVIERRQSAAACDANGWQGLTDINNVLISQLTFTLSEQVTGSITEQLLDIVMIVESATDGTLEREYSAQVVIRNGF
ncbi:hypothetical protein C9927_00760 [Pseudidiomarina aestuarii]|uniref:Prepilin-type N-terminal cleavage/methylation domain-containing protein n=1 Tax=Pseudidiomarina aestuarii TaxID=624146 RepID=A0A2T4CNP4_9GAMM|nr:hypothetical protein C9986_01045 [Pseudidiomarina aestuarii]PTB90116.1 hypothetical protein C9927_00760 [Pseudidiomarina aestuarii]